MKRRTKDEEGTANLLIEVAHDLQNPISSIISACEYLAAYSHRANRVQLEMIAGIEASASTLLRLSTRISDLARQGSCSVARNAE
jgi:K+-sensing histidine kinase KdpD